MSVSLVDEIANADFGDQRLSRRLEKLAEELGSQPSHSIPSASSGRAEMEAAYRFFDNAKVTPEKILQPHFDATLERIRETEMVLLVQDTTELNLNRPNEIVEGTGPMDCESRRGAFYHPLIGFDSDGVPLGMVWQKSWVRSHINTRHDNSKKALNRKHTPVENKESLRWVEGANASVQVAKACPDTTCVCVGDSESDIYEVYSQLCQNTPANLQLLVRACQNRATTDQSNLLDTVRATDCLYCCTVDVGARTSKITDNRDRKRKQSRQARVAEVEVRASSVILRPPWRFDRRLPELKVNIVLVEETNPPSGCESIQWILVTTLPIEHSEQVRTVVQAYCIRWQIEIFFKTLKTGCRIEKRQFETLDRILNCVALYSIVSWRIMYLCRLGHACPDLNCEVIFEPCEWKAVYLVAKQKPLPKNPPTLNEIIRLIASLGGYVMRKSTRPGPQTFWVGIQRAHNFALAWEAFGPGSNFFKT